VSITAIRGFGRSAIAQSEALDHRVQLRRLLRRHDLGARRGERELVGGVVLEQGHPDDDHEHRHEPDAQDVEQDDCEDDVEKAEHPAGQQHAEGQTCVATVRLALHENRSPRERRGLPKLYRRALG